MVSVREGAGWENIYGVSKGGGGRMCTVSVREGYQVGWKNMYSVSEKGGRMGEYV